MKKFLLLMCAAATLSTAATSAAEVQFVNLGKKYLSEKTMNQRKQAKNVIMKATASVWKPGTFTSYSWQETYDDMGMPTGADWQLMDSRTITYFENGNKKSEKSGDSLMEYEYDAEKRVVKYTISSEFEGKKTVHFTEEYVYDTVVKDLIVKTTSTNYNDGTATEVYVSGDDITRNEAGNIVKIEDYTIQNGGSKTVDTRIEYTYGTDAKINAIKVYERDNDQMLLDSDMLDIVWYQTNGQLVEIDIDEEDFFMGANRLKSARFPKATNAPYVADILMSVEYKADNKGYNMKAVMAGEDYMVTDFTYTDAFGSYVQSDFSVDYDNVDGDVYERDGADLTVYTKTYDAYGLLLLDEEKSYVDGDINKGISYQQTTKGTATYDSEHGYPTEYITENSYDGGEFRKQNREVYGDYQQFESGVESAIVDSENAEVEYFNLQGIKVSNPSEGIYIRRQGNKVSKVIVR